MDGRRPLRVPVKYRRRSKKPTITSSSSSSEDDKDHDIHLLDVLTDVQKFLGHLNREHLTQGCRSMTQNLATKIDHVTRRSKSKSRWILDTKWFIILSWLMKYIFSEKRLSYHALLRPGLETEKVENHVRDYRWSYDG